MIRLDYRLHYKDEYPEFYEIIFWMDLPQKDHRVIDGLKWFSTGVLYSLYNDLLNPFVVMTHQSYELLTFLRQLIRWELKKRYSLEEKVDILTVPYSRWLDKWAIWCRRQEYEEQNLPIYRIDFRNYREPAPFAF